MKTKLVGGLVSALAISAWIGACSTSSTEPVVSSDSGSEIDSGTDGSAVADATLSQPCTGGQKVQFALAVDKAYCTGAAGSCDNSIFSIKKADGTTIHGIHSNRCVSSCDTCMALGCPADCPIPTLLPSTGATAEWDGTFFTTSTCGANNLSCAIAECAPAGTYTVKMCVLEAVSDGDGGSMCPSSGTPVCTEQTFEWPPAADGGVVTAALGSTK